MAYGQYGTTQISDTDPHTGHWNGIFVVADTKFTTFTDSERTDCGVITGPTFKAGAFFPCSATAITLASGAIVASKARSLSEG